MNGNIDEVIDVVRRGDNYIWIEKGKPGPGGSGLAHMLNSSAGQNHIEEISKAFFNSTKNQDEIVDFILEHSVDYFKGQRLSGEIPIPNSNKYLHIEIGSNGYVVDAYPLPFEKTKNILSK